VLNRQIVLVSMATEVCDIHHYPCMDVKICGHAAYYALYCYSVDTREYPFTSMAMGGINCVGSKCVSNL
jgi:hypothetical protein